MKNFRTCLWQITAKTNLHVGNEDSTSYGIIDKAVQRDVLTGLPCINSSSLKGAINEYCCSGLDGKEVMSQDEREWIFGSNKKDSNSPSKKGVAVFFDAQLLYLPVQDDDLLYIYITSDEVQNRLMDRLGLFGITETPAFKKIEGHDCVGNKKDSYELSQLCKNTNLPIIARNVLVDGESKNLWYEQVIPAETIFYAITQEPLKFEREDDSTGKAVLADAINNRIIQIGANATIGYGYCKFDLIYYKDEDKGTK